MAAPIFLPPFMKGTKSCERCKRQYPKKETVCPHCSHLSDAQLAELQEHREQELAAAGRLGQVFLAIAVGLAVMLLLIVMD